MVSLHAIWKSCSSRGVYPDALSRLFVDSRRPSSGSAKRPNDSAIRCSQSWRLACNAVKRVAYKGSVFYKLLQQCPDLLRQHVKQCRPSERTEHYLFWLWSLPDSLFNFSCYSIATFICITCPIFPDGSKDIYPSLPARPVHITVDVIHVSQKGNLGRKKL